MTCRCFQGVKVYRKLCRFWIKNPTALQRVINGLVCAKNIYPVLLRGKHREKELITLMTTLWSSVPPPRWLALIARFLRLPTVRDMDGVGSFLLLVKKIFPLSVKVLLRAFARFGASLSSFLPSAATRYQLEGELRWKLNWVAAPGFSLSCVPVQRWSYASAYLGYRWCFLFGLPGSSPCNYHFHNKTPSGVTLNVISMVDGQGH